MHTRKKTPIAAAATTATATACVGLLVAISVLCLGPAVVSGATYAVLVAGSNQFYNYRHQTDICHAYHVMMEHGVPPQNVIVMIYDDIANDPANPFPGKLFNQPTTSGTPGVDVYDGCVKDYTGLDVTAANFLNVITGNSSAMHGIGTGRVLDSGTDDHVFLYFSDHGGSGIVAFPTGPFLTAIDLNAALLQMHDTAMYGKLTFYLEACESGSMFQDLLPDDLNIYVTTASKSDESSWGTYCPPDDAVNGIEIGACLGDLYSVNWMQNADAASLSESLETQYMIVRNLTTMSTVTQWGEQDWVDLAIGDFEGNWSEQATDATAHNVDAEADATDQGSAQALGRRGHRLARSTATRVPTPTHRIPLPPLPRGYTPRTRAYESSMIDSRDAKLQYLYWNYVRAKTPTETNQFGDELKQEVDARRRADELFAEFVRRVDAGGDEASHNAMLHSHFGHPSNCGSCCQPLFELVRNECPALSDNSNGWSDYALKYTRTLVNACDSVSHHRQTASRLRSVLRALCSAPSPSMQQQ